MAVRSSCADLRARVRTLLGVASTDALLPSESEQQAFLDQHMQSVQEEPLCPVRTIDPDAYIEWHARRGGFDTDAKILNLNNDRAVLAAGDFDESEPIAGFWKVDTAMAATLPYLSITGRRYDVHGAAADLGECLIGQMRVSGVDVSNEDTNLKRNQMIKTMEATVARLRARQWIGTSGAYRSDINRNRGI